jgi:hypothetical protein
MKTVIGNIVPKVEKAWDNRNNDFWKAFAESYFVKDCIACGKKKFITAIDFYPHLIKTLIEHVQKMDKTVRPAIEITFFSTLLPRHYWNFPLPISEQAMANDSDFYDAQIPYIDEYRESIENAIGQKDVNLILRRILLLSANKNNESSGSNLFGVHLFHYGELNRDRLCTIPKLILPWNKQTYKWSDNKNTAKNLSCLHKDHIKLDRLSPLYEEAKRKWEKIKDTRLHKFEHIEEDNQTIFDYYINKMHSSTNEAKYIIFDHNRGSQARRKNKYHITPIENTDIFKTISLDSALIKFGQEEFILDVYMSLAQEIVSIKVINNSDDDFREKKTEFDAIVALANIFPSMTEQTPKPTMPA